MKDINEMSKEELVEEILALNRGIIRKFLLEFSEEELRNYLKHLIELDVSN